MRGGILPRLLVSAAIVVFPDASLGLAATGTSTLLRCEAGVVAASKIYG